ncbi:T9SS type A sorting domain-containing protein [Bacteroidota bacterium]
MNFKLGIISLFLCMVSLSVIHAQEVLVPVGLPDTPLTQTKKSTGIDDVPDTLEVPFFDDFSKKGWLPHPEFWLDEFVYINNSFTRDPVTIGVATLDAIYSDGKLNGSSSTPFESDFLTSVPINLDYPGRQDVYLSFFYGRRGLGDPPELDDSLTVEFFAPDSNQWVTVWATPGFSEDPAPEEDTFKQVFIPVNQERFLKKGFHFRFKNYASLPTDLLKKDYWGNVDHWNIDYVYLDTARSPNVTAINDVSMISSLGSILKTYQSIPWKHFGSARVKELQPFVEIQYRNNDTTTRNVTRVLKITDLNYNHTDSVIGGAVNVAPGVLNTFQFPNDFPYFFYEEDDSNVFKIMSYLVTEDLDIKTNDTVVRYQRFYNYYAYDDGSSENGYGLNGEGTSNASIAYQFNTFKPDTLRGVQFYFNRTIGDFTQDYFRLGVWDHDDDLDGPGELIRSMEGVRPEYGSELNQFYTYALDTTIIVSNTFYVGWIKTTETLLNVGWDRWNNNRSKIFYNMGQGWVNTIFNGSLMIRPLMGSELVYPVAVPEIPEVENIQLHVYPNPAGDQFYVELSQNTSSGKNEGKWSLSMYNLQGKMVYTSVLRSEYSTKSPHYIGDLPQGLYIVRVNHDGIYVTSSKLMIVR